MAGRQNAGVDGRLADALASLHLTEPEGLHAAHAHATFGHECDYNLR